LKKKCANFAKKNPEKPKKPLSAYIVFVAATRPQIRKEKPELTFGQVASELGVRWKALSADAKKSYEEKAEKLGADSKYDQKIDEWRAHNQKIHAERTALRQQAQQAKKEKRDKDPETPAQ